MAAVESPHEIETRIVQHARSFRGEEVVSGHVAVVGILTTRDQRRQIGVRYRQQGWHALDPENLEDGSCFEPVATVATIRQYANELSDSDAADILHGEIYRRNMRPDIYDPFRAPAALCG